MEETQVATQAPPSTTQALPDATQAPPDATQAPPDANRAPPDATQATPTTAQDTPTRGSDSVQSVLESLVSGSGSVSSLANKDKNALRDHEMAAQRLEELQNQLIGGEKAGN